MPVAEHGGFIQALKPGVNQHVAYNGTAGTSNAVNSNTRVIRVVCTSDAFVKVAASPTAVNTDTFMPAGIPEYFRCAGNDKVSAIQNSASGTCRITEMS